MTPYIHTYYVDVRNGLEIQRERRPIASGDRNADQFVVYLHDQRVVVDLTGAAVSGKVIRPDGQTVPLIGKVSDNAAVITLDESCYEVPGEIKLTVTVSAGDVVQSVLVVMMDVQTSETSVVVDNGVIGSLSSLLAEIANMRAATQAATEAANTVQERLSKAFALSNDHVVGLSQDDNIDEVLTPGNYRIASQAVLESMGGTKPPTNVTGRLMVIETIAGQLHQMYFGNGISARIYVRYYNGSVWREWKTLAVMSDLTDLESRINEIIDAVAENVQKNADGVKSVSDGLAKAYTLAAGSITEIPEGADFDSYTTPGNYGVSTLAIAQTISNIPSQMSGRLTVFTTTQTKYIVQVYETNVAKTGVFVRTKTSAADDPTWNPWYKFAYTSDIGEQLAGYFALANENSTGIAEGTDLNTLLTPGSYRISSASTLATLLNAPPTTVAGRLMVIETTAGRYYQIYYSNHINARIYQRYYDGTSWREWKSLALGSDIPKIGQFLPVRRASSFSWNYDMTITATGTEEFSWHGSLTDLIPVAANASVQNTSPAFDHAGREFHVYVAEFSDGVFQKRTRVESGSIHTCTDTTNGMKLLAIYPADGRMMAANLMQNFSVGMVGNIAPGDGRRPVYVAFGASTTVGAIHHFTGVTPSVTYTPNAFPDYIGQILGLETHNLGNGTTGFMARYDGQAPNFMDAIYNNDEVLKRADLITLMFGYGNDKTAGLPFGEWDDYFPYDDIGSFYVEGDTAANEAGITTMLNAGATLTGCLNWCIKWIGEHYPQAILVCLYGAPSGNDEYSVSVVANNATNAGTAGVAPKKIATSRPAKDYEEEYEQYKTINMLKAKLNIPLVNLMDDGLPFSYYSTHATDENGHYAVFSTKGTEDAPVWNSHPNEVGYLVYARYLAGRISQYFRH